MRENILLKISAVVSAVSGVVILTAVLIPIVLYESPALISPLPQDAKNSSEIDYTKASNWFLGGKSEKDFVATEVSYYTLSIKKLGIEDATVAVGGEDLSKSLVQYPGTALPGKKGNSVIFGHSILPIFYNPKDYIAIFSTLPTLKKGDEIDVDYDGVSYKYRVETLFEVLPTDLEVLEQDDTDSFLTLVTCVPPGDPRKPKRLIVRARIVPPEVSYENTRH